MSIRTSPLVAVALFAGLALAGCLGDDAPPASETPPPTSPSTGAVHGRILDAALEPVPNALVGLFTDADVVHETRTDAEGRYALDGVAPGTYRLQASALCCRATVRSVTVTAEEITQGDMRLVRLSADDLQLAAVDQKEWKGFISCGVSAVVVSAAACSLFEETPVEDPNEEFLLEFPVARGVRTIVVGMDWDPSGGVLGNEFDLSLENDDCGFDACSYEYARVQGAPPIVFRVDDADITDAAWKWTAVNDTRLLQFRVFAGGQANVVYQQPFEIHYHVFYWEPAPEGYNPLPDQ